MRSNLNMPPFLPAWGGNRDYDMDAPITVFGAIQARTVGMWELFSLHKKKKKQSREALSECVPDCVLQVKHYWRIILLLTLCTAHPVSGVSKQPTRSSKVISNLLLSITVTYSNV